MRRNKTWTAWAVAALLCTAAEGFAADVGKKKHEPAHLEAIPGTKLHRVRLEPRAAERLGIETASVREGAVARTRVVAGIVLMPSEADRIGLKSEGDSYRGNVWIQAFSTGDVDKLSRTEPAHVLPLARGGQAMRLRAVPASNSRKDPQGALYYMVESAKDRLASNQRVLVEVPYEGATRISIPFGSIIYNDRGEAWVYTQSEPLTYARHRIDIDYVTGDVAVLKDGPAPGTEVVAVGASLLFGTEMKVGH